MQTCQVINAWPPVEANNAGQAECGEPAALLVNGSPMCGDHIGQYAREGLIESADLLPEDGHLLEEDSGAEILPRQ